MPFNLFSPLHIGILLTIAASGSILGRMSRTHERARVIILRTGAGLLAVLELVWYGYLFQRPSPVWPGILPLHLCDVVLWLTVISAFFPWQRVRELAYYYGLAGTSMALLMPDVQGLRVSYPLVQFFISHGLVVTLILVLVLSGEFRPGPHSLIRAIVLLHVYAALVGCFNAVFGTNYMYLCSRPGGASILDFLGPWPWYLVGSDIVGTGLFLALWWPFRQAGASAVTQDPGG